jgi:hypothetical protein
LCGLPGAISSVAAGAAITIATGGVYGVTALLTDAGTGAMCLGALAKLKALGTVMDALSDAKRVLGAGRGAIFGTKVHTVVERSLHAAGDKVVRAERSYLNGQVVPRGTKGSVRLDAVEGPLDNPVAVFDLKTGNAKLTADRITEIRRHLPNEGKDVIFVEVK